MHRVSALASRQLASLAANRSARSTNARSLVSSAIQRVRVFTQSPASQYSIRQVNTQSDDRDVSTDELEFVDVDAVYYQQRKELHDASLKSNQQQFLGAGLVDSDGNPIDEDYIEEEVDILRNSPDKTVDALSLESSLLRLTTLRAARAAAVVAVDDVDALGDEDIDVSPALSAVEATQLSDVAAGRTRAKPPPLPPFRQPLATTFAPTVSFPRAAPPVAFEDAAFEGDMQLGQLGTPPREILAPQVPTQCPLCRKDAPPIDYKNIELLSLFTSPTGRIMPRSKTGICAKQQRALARAIKRARNFALMPIITKLPKYNQSPLPRIPATIHPDLRRYGDKYLRLWGIQPQRPPPSHRVSSPLSSSQQQNQPEQAPVPPHQPALSPTQVPPAGSVVS
mmetsp:Transcript_16583/g.27407  ORF Transcript_16583/g.27407 Transcript_16583/m.27407 type:complete len:395 (+) Transcript_16583:56-1240(+)